jgi:hypothetical protein
MKKVIYFWNSDYFIIAEPGQVGFLNCYSTKNAKKQLRDLIDGYRELGVAVYKKYRWSFANMCLKTVYEIDIEDGFGREGVG